MSGAFYSWRWTDARTNSVLLRNIYALCVRMRISMFVRVRTRRGKNSGYRTFWQTCVERTLSYAFTYVQGVIVYRVKNAALERCTWELRMWTLGMKFLCAPQLICTSKLFTYFHTFKSYICYAEKSLFSNPGWTSWIWIITLCPWICPFLLYYSATHAVQKKTLSLKTIAIIFCATLVKIWRFVHKIFNFQIKKNSLIKVLGTFVSCSWNSTYFRIFLFHIRIIFEFYNIRTVHGL